MSTKQIYNPKELESRWQKYWKDNLTYKTPDKGEKEYVLGMLGGERGCREFVENWIKYKNEFNGRLF